MDILLFIIAYVMLGAFPFYSHKDKLHYTVLVFFKLRAYVLADVWNFQSFDRIEYNDG